MSPLPAIKNTEFDLDKKALANRFGSRAESYEAATPVQKVMGQCLLDRIRSEQPNGGVREILEVGCGTGRLTRALKALFPSANITAIDISQEMIDHAKKQVPGPAYLVIDAEEYLQSLNRQFDLIVSNATVQWFVHLDKAIGRMCSALAPGGFLALGTFAERTFCELADEALYKKPGSREIQATYHACFLFYRRPPG